MSNLGKKRNTHLWKVGSKLVYNTKVYHPYFWVITKIEGDYVHLDSYYNDDPVTYFRSVGKFSIETLENLSLYENKVTVTRLAKKMYPNAKEEGGYLLIPC